MIRFLMRWSLSKLFSTCNGDIAQKSTGSEKFASGFEVRFVTQSFSLRSAARTSIIFPEMYSTGRQSNAESPMFRPKKSQVIAAEARIRFFSISNIFGAPVEPEV